MNTCRKGGEAVRIPERTDLKPIEIMQSDGVSFTLEDGVLGRDPSRSRRHDTATRRRAFDYFAFPAGGSRLIVALATEKFTGQVLEPVCGFRSLFAFKAKFQPGYRPMYLAYPDPAALPRIANAVGRAYLPQVTLRQGLRLAVKMITRS